jgi:hypothetical protein
MSLCRAVTDSPMTTLATLRARKQKLLEQLKENPGPNERDEIEHFLQKIDMALDLLNDAGPSADGN